MQSVFLSSGTRIFLVADDEKKETKYNENIILSCDNVLQDELPAKSFAWTFCVRHLSRFV